MDKAVHRITEVCENGTWFVKGLPWMDIAENRTISRATAERLYTCLDRLKEYEDTGMSPEDILEMRGA